MKLASLKHGRDGRLVVVDTALQWAVAVPDIASTMQQAIDDWPACAPRLQAVSDRLAAGDRHGAIAFDPWQADAPLPRAYQWCEASAYLVHLERTRRSTGRELPPSLYTDPGVWQGVSNHFIPPQGDMPVFEEWDIDLEPSVAVITGDVPMGASVEEAAAAIRLVVLLNDVSLRAIQIPEMTKGLGIIQGKPYKGFAPVAVTPQGLGPLWTGTMLSCAVTVKVNEDIIGTALADQDYNFDLPTIIAYVARTRHVGAGSIISCGTVANRDPARGSSCLMEKRAVEILEQGGARTPWLRFGDRIHIECLDPQGRSVFGAMSNRIVKAQRQPAAA